jgi:hypothetical protein
MVSKRKVSKKRIKKVLKDSGKEKDEMGRAQVWSVDVLLALVIFVSVILIFYATMTARQKTGLRTLEAEASNLKAELELNHEFGFIVNDKIDPVKFKAFLDNSTQDYQMLKEKLGVKGDFCVFYEDKDGNLILVGDNRTGAGSSNISIETYACGAKVS